MEQKIVKKLGENAKSIKVSGQATGSDDCMYDCHIQEKELLYREYLPNQMPCYIDHYRITADYYNQSWTSWF